MSTSSPDRPRGIMKFLGESKRRHVFKVAVVYAVVGLAVAEGAEVFLGNLGGAGWAVSSTG